MRYTSDRPTQKGYYWVSRKGLGFGEVVKILDDRLTGRGLVVCGIHNAHLRKLPALDEFCLDDTLWAGPIEPPIEGDEDVNLP